MPRPVDPHRRAAVLEKAADYVLERGLAGVSLRPLARALGTSGAVRVDLLVTSGENEYVLEVNTLPGMTETSLLPKIAADAGYDFGQLCEAILSTARLHQPVRRAPAARESEQRAPQRRGRDDGGLWLLKSAV